MVDENMPPGIQELIALGIVMSVVAFAVYRRWRRARSDASACSDCDRNPPKPDTEKTVHFYRRNS